MRSGRRLMFKSYVDNFKTYWKSHVFGHVPVGLMAGALLTSPYPYAGMTLALFALGRQALGFWEKKDTVSIDLAWILGALFLGILLSI